MSKKKAAKKTTKKTVKKTTQKPSKKSAHVKRKAVIDQKLSPAAKDTSGPAIITGGPGRV